MINEHDISERKHSERLLREQQTKTDSLLYSMLPQEIVTVLRKVASERESVCVCLCERERECVYICVCVCERERVCVYICV